MRNIDVYTHLWVNESYESMSKILGDACLAGGGAADVFAGEAMPIGFTLVAQGGG
jgi:hypothetical protein